MCAVEAATNCLLLRRPEKLSPARLLLLYDNVSVAPGLGLNISQHPPSRGPLLALLDGLVRGSGSTSIYPHFTGSGLQHYIRGLIAAKPNGANSSRPAAYVRETSVS